MNRTLITALAVVSALLICQVEGHGYMLNPPQRNSAWRAGFKTPTDSNDMANFCGGRGTQHNKNGGKCGVCGEEYLNPNKRFEPGPANKYATGTIVGDYRHGQTIDVTIMITAFHKGYYEFRLCQNNVPQKGKDNSVAVTYDCLNKNLLKSAKTGGTQFTATMGKSTHQVELPEGVDCTACVLQWRYRTGNNWGCENGDCGLGIGPQEEFVGCADIAIQSSGNVSNGKKTQQLVKATRKTTERPKAITKRPATKKPKPAAKPTAKPAPKPAANPVPKPAARFTAMKGRKICRGSSSHGPGLSSWCDTNCNHDPPYCPSSHCTCQ